MQIETDCIVIGSGIAGLSLALKLSSICNVCVLTKKNATDTATNLAQGGIACVMSEDDSFDLHEQDTIRAGDGLCHETIVSLIIRNAPRLIKELIELGVPFTKSKNDPNRFDLAQEGGHSRRRILHVEDFTGRAIQKALLNKILEKDNISLFEDHIAIDLITEGKIRGKSKGQRCLGAYVLEVKTGEIHTFLAPVTIIATGGAGKVYLYTSNPDVATGDGIAMAYRAGARIANLEFVQFHPTCLYHPDAKNFLISEALRGEGARLINYEGKRFMEEYEPVKKELACRDIVARAIDSELKKSGKECVYLDITHKGKDFIISRFPNIYHACLKFGIDITKEPIPVVPAAHYMCGGIVTDYWAQTDITGLFAVGECACSGLHGANRLASNSLLEGLVMADQAYKKIKDIFPKLKASPIPPVPAWDPGGAIDMDEAVLISYNWDMIRRLMWYYVGIVRNEKRLSLALRKLKPVLEEINEHYWSYILTRDFIELRNLAQVAHLIIKAAFMRKESRGGHYNQDYPQKDDWNWRRDTILLREGL